MKTCDAGVLLKSMGACDGAIEWARGKTPDAAWQECKRGDWMLWYAAKVCRREDVVLADAAAAYADAAAAAVYAADADAASAREYTLARCADIVRRFWPEIPTKRGDK